VSGDGLTEAELVHAREVVRTRWPAEARRELWELDAGEQQVVAALCGLLDAEPVDPVTLEPLGEQRPRCALCGADRFRLRRAPGGGFVCSFVPACRYRARVAMGMPRWRALRMLEAEKAARS
jgi:hypothetical protein